MFVETIIRMTSSNGVEQARWSESSDTGRKLSEELRETKKDREVRRIWTGEESRMRMTKEKWVSLIG